MIKTFFVVVVDLDPKLKQLCEKLMSTVTFDSRIFDTHFMPKRNILPRFRDAARKVQKEVNVMSLWKNVTLHHTNKKV